jgi:hypothetical protein
VVQLLEPELVTTMVPTMVPAAPCVGPAVAVIEPQDGTVDPVVVVLDSAVVDVVVVVWCGGLAECFAGDELQAAPTTPAARTPVMTNVGRISRLN